MNWVKLAEQEIEKFKNKRIQLTEIKDLLERLLELVNKHLIVWQVLDKIKEGSKNG